VFSSWQNTNESGKTFSSWQNTNESGKTFLETIMPLQGALGADTCANSEKSESAKL